MKRLLNIRLLKVFTVISVVALVYHLAAPAFLDKTDAYAVGDLTVNWGVPEGSPIFTVLNFAPGQTESRPVIVTNNASVTRPVGTRVLNTAETGGLSQQIDFVISQGATDLYGGTSGAKTLAQFFTDSSGPDGVFLSNINPGATTTYTFKATFNPASDNSFQQTNIHFDIKIGVSEHIPAECQNIQFANIIFGTQNNDNISGTNGNDLIFGFEGNDKIFASNGNDCIVGAEGNDKIDGSNGNDVIIGGPGNDDIFGSNGNDTIQGNEGNDKIDGSNGDDQIDAGVGDDNVDGGNGNDTIILGPGKDKADGGNDSDNIQGNEGNDDIKGGNGSDTLVGGADTDKATGGLGIDTCDAETEASCEL